MKNYLLAPALASLLFAMPCPMLANDPDPDEYLNKRVFTISMSEIKFGQVSKKPISDVFVFKNGRMHSDYIHKKYGHKFIPYKVTRDSTYIDSTQTKVRTLEIEAVVTDENNKTVIIDLVTTEWDIDGTIKITKHDVLKRKLDFCGREKGGKPKKVKSKTNRSFIQLQS